MFRLCKPVGFLRKCVYLFRAAAVYVFERGGCRCARQPKPAALYAARYRTMQIEITTVGRRHYLIGLPYILKDAAKDAGCRWDPAQRAWWTGARKTAEHVLAAAQAAPATGTAAPDADAGDTVVAGRVQYRTHDGRTTSCLLVGRVVRGRTHYDDRVELVTSRTGAYRLCGRDGSRQWWADADRVEVIKVYDRPQTVRKLAHFAEKRRANGGVHPDACPMCGDLQCDRAYGRAGLCQHD